MFKELESLKRQNKTIGFTASTFDLLHAGHVEMLEKAASLCDYLVVGLLSDPTISRPNVKQKPVQSLYERFVQLQAISSVDLIVPFDTEDDLVDMINMIKPHKRFVGEEYKHVDHTGKTIEGVEIIYNERRHEFSSSELRNRCKEF